MKHAWQILTIGLTGLVLALPAQAARPTYSYLELDYLSTDYGNDDKADGGRLLFNVSLERWIFFTGEYNHADSDLSDEQTRATSLGFGTHSMGAKLQVYGAATYERSDVFGADATDEGYAMQVGVRWPVWSGLSFDGDVKWFNFGKALHLDRHRATLQWRLSPTWAAVSSYQHTNYPAASSHDWTVGFRAYFTTQYDLPLRRPAAPPTP